MMTPFPMQARLHKAIEHLDAGQTTIARIALEDLAIKHPDHAEIHYQLGRLLIGCKHYKRASKSLEIALRELTDHGNAWRYSGQCARKLGQLTKAIHAYEQALKLQEDDINTQIALGYLLLENNQPDRAAVPITSLYQTAPQMPAVLAVTSALMRSKGQFEDAAKLCEVAIQKDPHAYPAYREYGKLFMAAGKPGQAHSYLQKALQLRSELAEAHYNLASFFLERNKLGYAIAACTSVLEKEAEYHAAYVLRAKAYQLQENHGKALQDFHTAKHLNPEWGTTEWGIVWHAIRAGEMSLAEEWLQERSQVAMDRPTPITDTPKLRAVQGSLSYFKGDFERAAKLRQEALLDRIRDAKTHTWDA